MLSCNLQCFPVPFSFGSYYDPKLGSGCNLGKDLSKRGEKQYNVSVRIEDSGLDNFYFSL